MRVTRRLAWGAALLVGCTSGESTAPAPHPLALCGGALHVSIAQNEISWTPSCGATYLEVVTSDRLRATWIVRADTGKAGPGVRYGSAPASFLTLLGPELLERGRSYVVRVGVTVDEDSFFIFGEGTFTVPE